MPEIPAGVWLTPEEVEPEAVLTFVDAGQRSEIPAQGGRPAKQTFEITVRKANGVERTWTMNSTSQRAVAKAYGTNSDAWVGKRVTVYTSEGNVNGTPKKIIYARTPAPVQAMPAPVSTVASASQAGPANGA